MIDYKQNFFRPCWTKYTINTKEIYNQVFKQEGKEDIVSIEIKGQ